MTKWTFQPDNRCRAEVYGFHKRMPARTDRTILATRRRKGRYSLSA